MDRVLLVSFIATFNQRGVSYVIHTYVCTTMYACYDFAVLVWENEFGDVLLCVFRIVNGLIFCESIQSIEVGSKCPIFYRLPA